MKALFLCTTAMSLSPLLAPALAISVSQFNVAYTENFNTLAISGTGTAVPAGWAFAESGSSANSTYTAGTGSGTGGDTYSFGAASSTERAFGTLQTGSVIPTIGASFQNDTASVITTLQISYWGEQWRLGTLGRADRLDFQYSLDASSLTTGTWLDFDGLDYNAPTTTGSTGLLDGNSAANRTLLSDTLNLNWVQGGTMWIRWNDFNASSSDDGLAIDDFSLTAVQATTVPDGSPGIAGFLVLIGLLIFARPRATNPTHAASFSAE
jgi:uncharacterized protein